MRGSAKNKTELKNGENSFNIEHKASLSLCRSSRRTPQRTYDVHGEWVEYSRSRISLYCLAAGTIWTYFTSSSHRQDRSCAALLFYRSIIFSFEQTGGKVQILSMQLSHHPAPPKNCSIKRNDEHIKLWCVLLVAHVPNTLIIIKYYIRAQGCRLLRM